MIIKLKVWHLFIALCITLIIIRFTLIIDLYLTSIFVISFCFVSDFSNAISQLNFELVDYFVSGTL